MTLPKLVPARMAFQLGQQDYLDWSMTGEIRVIPNPFPPSSSNWWRWHDGWTQESDDQLDIWNAHHNA